MLRWKTPRCWSDSHELRFSWFALEQHFEAHDRIPALELSRHTKNNDIFKNRDTDELASYSSRNSACRCVFGQSNSQIFPNKFRSEHFNVKHKDQSLWMHCVSDTSTIFVRNRVLFKTRTFVRFCLLASDDLKIQVTICDSGVWTSIWIKIRDLFPMQKYLSRNTL